MTTKPKFKKKADPTPDVVVSDRMREEMLAIAVRNVEAFAAIRQHLDPPQMKRVGQVFAVVWKAACDYHQATGKLPDYTLLSAEASRVQEDEEYALSPSQTDELNGLLTLIFDDTPYKTPVEDSAEHANWAIATAKKLLTQLAADQLKETLDTPEGLLDLPTILQAMCDNVAAVRSMAASTSGDLFAHGWDVQEQKPLYSTGLAFINEFIGGMRPGEVYGFLGPYGSCKTTVAVQGVVAAGNQCATLYEEALAAHQKALAAWKAGGKAGPRPPKPKRPMAFYASYETPIQEFRERCLAFAAKVPRDRLMKMDHRGVGSLRGPADEPQDYEKVLYADEIATKVGFPSERARVLAEAATLNKYVVFLDMTGKTAERREKGQGGVAELAAELAVELKLREARAYVLWLDHAASMCEEEMIKKELDSSRRRELLRRIPKMLGTLIAGPMDTSVFVLQQLSGEANSRGSTAKIDHTDSDECKSFGMYLDFALTVTRPNPEQVSIVRCTKHRRTPPMPHKFLRVVGEYNRVEDVSEFYTLEGGGLGIVAKHDKEMVATVSDILESHADSKKPKKKAQNNPVV